MSDTEIKLPRGCKNITNTGIQQIEVGNEKIEVDTDVQIRYSSEDWNRWLREINGQQRNDTT